MLRLADTTRRAWCVQPEVRLRVLELLTRVVAGSGEEAEARQALEPLGVREAVSPRPAPGVCVARVGPGALLPWWRGRRL